MDDKQPSSPENSQFISLRAVCPGDEDFLFHLYATTREEELALVPWDDAQKNAFLRMQYAAQKSDYELRLREAEHSIVHRDGVPVGRIWIHRSSDEIRLLDIIIAPEHRNSGIGSFLLRSLIAESKKDGRPLRHMVHLGNTSAIRLYQRLGFTIVGEAGMHYLMELMDNPT